MAYLNGSSVNFIGLSSAQIGEKLAEASPDATNIVLELTLQEERALIKWGGNRIGHNLAILIGNAIERRTGKRPNLSYSYARRIFTTRGG